ncbi:MAG: radical SAM protein, partial [Armatimonadota bacterium]
MAESSAAARRSGHPTKPRALIHPPDLQAYVPELPSERIAQAAEVASEFAFRLPAFYAANVLNGDPNDPLLDLVFPSSGELEDGDELWDATPSAYRASRSPFWIQKYEYEGLIRLTSVCSGLCRFCYLKKKNAERRVMSVEDVDQLFDDLEVYGMRLREVILSGGDPLCAPTDVLEAVATRMKRLHALLGRETPYVTVHTREPVWDPVRLMSRKSLIAVLGALRPRAYIIHVIHPREVTPAFKDACAMVAGAAGPQCRPALLCQHPLFRGVNDSVEVLEELYLKLLQCSPPVVPYYLV